MSETPVHGSPTTVEQRISREHRLLVAILGKPANAVLRMAGGIKALHSNAPNLEAFAVGWCLGHRIAVLTPNDGEIRSP